MKPISEVPHLRSSGHTIVREEVLCESRKKLPRLPRPDSWGSRPEINFLRGRAAVISVGATSFEAQD